MAEFKQDARDEVDQGFQWGDFGSPCVNSTNQNEMGDVASSPRRPPAKLDLRRLGDPTVLTFRSPSFGKKKSISTLMHESYGI